MGLATMTPQYFALSLQELITGKPTRDGLSRLYIDGPTLIQKTKKNHAS